MEMDNIFLNKLPIVAATGSEGGTWNHYAFIESTWGERKILLKIIVFSPLYNTPLSFLSEIDHEVLQQTAIRLEKPWAQFLHETKLALCTEGGAIGFNYAVEENNFVWRKIIGPNLIVTYGSVILLRSQCLLSDVLSNSIATQNRLRCDVQLKNKVLHELKEEHEELVELQRQQEEDSRLYEIELITKCISILNEKKEVINHLKMKLAEDEEDEDEPKDHDDQSNVQEQQQQQQQQQQQHTGKAAGDSMRSFPQDDPKSSSPTSAWVDFSDSEPFSLDPIVHDPEEHGVLPKRTKYQPTHRGASSTCVGAGSSSTVTRLAEADDADKRDATDAQEEDFYNKNTEELLQQM